MSEEPLGSTRHGYPNFLNEFELFDQLDSANVADAEDCFRVISCIPD